ncbi:MAG: CheR family methyltransferase [Promethearchaeota archaeon]
MIRIENITFDEDYYNLLLDFLSHETNLDFGYYRDNFVKRRIKARMIRVNCSTLHSYYYYIKDNPLEIQKFLDSFNINYSCFFRNWEVFKQFENFFLKTLNLDRKAIISDMEPNSKRKTNNKIETEVLYKNTSINDDKYRHIKFSNSQLALSFIKKTSIYRKVWTQSDSNNIIHIWSCPCASGEEPFSIAMVLDNLKRQISYLPQFKIIASDIDKDALNRANIGIYNESALNEVSNLFILNYFTKIHGYFRDKFSVSNKIKNYVEFIEEDLTKGHKKSIKYDIIFCRYLLIYISRKARIRFLEIIEKELATGGLLILGKTESIFNTHKSLKLIDSRNQIYLKTG